LAYDTIGIRSPFLPEFIALEIERQCTLRQGIEIETGGILYQLTTGQLEGSFDSRISVRVEREEWTKDDDSNSAVPFRVVSEPYIYIEGSVHKALMGHNVFGGPTDFRKSCKFLIGLVSKLINMLLPSVDRWFVKRVDVSEIYNLGSFDACQEWFRGFVLSEFPRRQVTRYGTTGIYAPGSTTCVKFYHKGPEFGKHDRKRLKRYWDAQKVDELQSFANGIIRCEIEIKSKKLVYDFGTLPLVKNVTDEYLNAVHDREAVKLLREGTGDMNLVRRSEAVQERLFDSYSPRLAGLLLSTWSRLTIFGEKEVKKTMPERTWYRQKKQLESVGVSWKATDIMLKNITLVPQDFSPVRSDSRRLEVESPEVIAQLLRIA